MEDDVKTVFDSDLTFSFKHWESGENILGENIFGENMLCHRETMAASSHSWCEDKTGITLSLFLPQCFSFFSPVVSYRSLDKPYLSEAMFFSHWCESMGIRTLECCSKKSGRCCDYVNWWM